MVSTSSRQLIERVLSEVDARPVLVDIGASSAVPKVWKPVAHRSIYVGFDPDAREMPAALADAFFARHIVDRAVTSDSSSGQVDFFLTAYPACSSILPPDGEGLSGYLFRDLFRVERKTKVPSTTLNAALAQLSLDHVDWLKTDSQGTDLRLFMSLDASVRSRVLALDIEPGLIDAYRGEDLFVDAHRAVVQEGFWLSSLRVGEAVRMRPETLDRIPELRRPVAEGLLKASPGWVEARYLRTLEWLRERDPTERELAVLWAFAVLDDKLGFAFEVACEYQDLFADSKTADAMYGLRLPRRTQLTGLPRRAQLKASRVLRGVRSR